MQTKATIIYIEDDMEDWELLGHVLEKLHLNLNILHLHDGKQGLDYLLKAKENKRLPALVVLDLKTPKLSGMELLHIMRQDEVLKKIPTVAFSSSTLERNELAAMGIKLISKPGDLNKFAQDVKEIFSPKN